MPRPSRQQSQLAACVELSRGSRRSMLALGRPQRQPQPTRWPPNPRQMVASTFRASATMCVVRAALLGGARAALPRQLGAASDHPRQFPAHKQRLGFCRAFDCFSSAFFPCPVHSQSTQFGGSAPSAPAPPEEPDPGVRVFVRLPHSAATGGDAAARPPSLDFMVPRDADDPLEQLIDELHRSAANPALGLQLPRTFRLEYSDSSERRCIVANGPSLKRAMRGRLELELQLHATSAPDVRPARGRAPRVHAAAAQLRYVPCWAGLCTIPVPGSCRPLCCPVHAGARAQGRLLCAVQPPRVEVGAPEPDEPAPPLARHAPAAAAAGPAGATNVDPIVQIHRWKELARRDIAPSSGAIEITTTTFAKRFRDTVREPRSPAAVRRAAHWSPRCPCLSSRRP